MRTPANHSVCVDIARENVSTLFVKYHWPLRATCSLADDRRAPGLMAFMKISDFPKPDLAGSHGRARLFRDLVWEQICEAE